MTRKSIPRRRLARLALVRRWTFMLMFCSLFSSIRASGSAIPIPSFLNDDMGFAMVTVLEKGASSLVTSSSSYPAFVSPSYAISDFFSLDSWGQIGWIISFAVFQALIIAALFFNLVKRQRAEQSLREKISQQDAVLASVPAAVFFKDRDSRYIAVNIGFCEWLNLPEKKIIGKSDYDFFSEEQAKYLIHDDQEVMKSGKAIINHEELIKFLNGKKIWVMTSKTPYYDDQGNVVGMVGISLDITARKKVREELKNYRNHLEQLVRQRTRELLEANDQLSDELTKRTMIEEELQDSVNKFTLIFENANDAIFWIDDTGTIILCNKMAETLMGMHRENLVGRDIKLFGENERNHSNSLKRLVENALDGMPVKGEARLELADEAPDVYVSTSITDVGESRIVQLLMQNISQRRKTELRIAELNQQLRDMSRLAGMSEVATNILHNVGNVLNSVNVSVQTLRQKNSNLHVDGIRKSAHALTNVTASAEDGEKSAKIGQLADYLTKIAHSFNEYQSFAESEYQRLTDNLSHIIGIMQTQQQYAGVSGLTEKIILKRMIEDVLILSEAGLAKREIRVYKDYSDVPELTGEKHKLIQILTNLIQNSIQALDASKKDAKHIVLRLFLDDDNQACIEVEDNGIGISSENLLKIFSHGFTTKKDGHGFGLHSCVLAAKEMGGSLSANSEGVERGAKFTLRIPYNPKT